VSFSHFAQPSTCDHGSVSTQPAPALRWSWVEDILRRHLVTARTVCVAWIQARPNLARWINHLNAVGAPSPAASALRLSVGKILGLRAKEQMIGSHTSAGVAAMEHEQAIGDLAMRQYPAIAVGSDDVSGRDAERAIAISVSSARPNPALAALVDMSPESDRRVRNCSRHQPLILSLRMSA